MNAINLIDLKTKFRQLILPIMLVIFCWDSPNVMVNWHFANNAASNGDRSPIEIIGIFARMKRPFKIGQYDLDVVTIYAKRRMNFKF